MYSTGMTYRLKPGCYAEYKKAHDELWPEIAEALAAHGISMAIYHHEGRLFLHAVAPTATAMQDSHAGPKAREWMAYMATLLETDASGVSIVEGMEPAFLFGQFAPDAA
ncbi:MAG: L-rhamnose mutarotase [Gemmatimonadota bacterium]